MIDTEMTIYTHPLHLKAKERARAAQVSKPIPEFVIAGLVQAINGIEAETAALSVNNKSGKRVENLCKRMRGYVRKLEEVNK